MNDRKPILLGGFFLALVVAAIGTTWALSERTADAAGPVSFSADAAFAQESPDPAQDPIPLDHTGPIAMTVHMDPNCGCCAGWVDHMREHGFEVEVEHTSDMAAVKREHSVPQAASSCHTAIVNGYVVEGHVPSDVVREFLAEAPNTAGIAAPGMPVGSPGMEAGGRVDPYDVITFTSDGRAAIYSRQGRD